MLVEVDLLFDFCSVESRQCLSSRPAAGGAVGQAEGQGRSHLTATELRLQQGLSVSAPTSALNDLISSVTLCL